VLVGAGGCWWVLVGVGVRVRWAAYKESMTELVSPSTLSIVASVLSLTSLVLSGLHCAFRRRAGEPTVLDVEFQPTRQMEPACQPQIASLAPSPGAGGASASMPVRTST
jgi:hypothetical protein